MPVATLMPHVHPWSAPGFPPYSLGARLPRTARRRAGRGGASTALVARGLEQGRREYNDCRARLGLAPLPGLHTGLSRALTLVGDAAAARVPARAGSRGCASSGRCCGSRRASASRRRRARAGRARRAVDGAGPRARAAARGARRPGAARPVRVIATYNGREPSPPVAVPAERRARALAVLRALDARLRRRRHPRRPRDARARARRAAARSSCAPRAATWPRTPRARTGPAWASGCRGGCSARARCGSRCGRALGDAGDARAGARRWPRGWRAHDGAGRPPCASWRRGAAACARGGGVGGPDRCHVDVVEEAHMTNRRAWLALLIDPVPDRRRLRRGRRRTEGGRGRRLRRAGRRGRQGDRPGVDGRPRRATSRSAPARTRPGPRPPASRSSTPRATA